VTVGFEFEFKESSEGTIEEKSRTKAAYILIS
jgi:hypothetical protein